MRPPVCRLCHEAHWGQCPVVAVQPSTDKPSRKALAARALASTAPAAEEVPITTPPSPKPPKGSARPPKAKPKKGKKAKAKAAPALPVERRPRGRPLQADEKNSYENTKPWKKMKISRRTFFRRLKKAAV